MRPRANRPTAAAPAKATANAAAIQTARSCVGSASRVALKGFVPVRGAGTAAALDGEVGVDAAGLEVAAAGRRHGGGPPGGDRRRVEGADRHHAPAGGERPVQQRRREPPGVDVRAQQGHHVAVPVPGRAAHEGRRGCRRVPVLDARGARVVEQQEVVVLDLVALPGAARPAALAREAVGLGADELGEGRFPQQRPAEDRQVVDAGGLPRCVEAAGVADDGVPGAQRVRGRGHELRRGRRTPDEAREGVRRVVAAAHEQPVPQVVDGVPRARDEPDPGAVHACVTGGGHVRLARIDAAVQGERGEDLQGARRRERHVRVAGGEHVPGPQVGDDPRGRAQRRGTGGSCGEGDLQARLGEPGAARRRGGRGQRRRRSRSCGRR